MPIRFVSGSFPRGGAFAVLAAPGVLCSCAVCGHVRGANNAKFNHSFCSSLGNDGLAAMRLN